MSEDNKKEDLEETTELENADVETDKDSNEPNVEIVSEDSMEAEVADMTVIKQQIAELNAKVADAEGKAIRAIAESENIRKRADKEKRDIVKFANKNLLTSMLSFMDNFEHAIDEKNKPTDELGVKFYEGVKMIHKQFVTFLADNGVEPMDEVGAEFDPNIHVAIGMEEDEKYEKETVIEVYSNGYKINGEVLRNATVRIGKPKA